jgi:hypothetical protein
LIKYPPKFNCSTVHNWGIFKKPDAMKEKDPSATPPLESFQPSPPLHHSMIPKMKRRRRRRVPLFNHPQNGNNPRKCHLLCTLRE